MKVAYGMEGFVPGWAAGAFGYVQLLLENPQDKCNHFTHNFQIFMLFSLFFFFFCLKRLKFSTECENCS